MRKKRKVPAHELAADVRAGWSDEKLREKYDVPPGVLHYLLKRLVHSGLITEMELFERTALSESDLFRAFSDQSKTILNCPICGKPFPDGEDQCWNCDTITSVFDLKVLMESVDSISDKEITPEKKEEEVALAFASQDLALIAACRDQTPERVRALLESGANMNSYDEEDITPLMAAASQGRLEIVELLLDWGADVNAVDRNGANAFFQAYSAGHRNVARLLAARGSNVTSQGGLVPENIVPVVKRAHSGARVVEAVLSVPAPSEKAGLRVSPPADFGSNGTKNGAAYEQARIKALAKAAGRGMIDHVELLLNKGVDVNSVSKNGNTPLMRASFKGHLAVARLLLARGADINAENAQGNSALLIASGACHPEIAALLLESGASANTKNLDGHTPLLLAATKDAAAIVEVLLKYGADPNDTDNNGDSPLMKAADHGFFVVAMLLLDAGAKVNAKNKLGNTALMKAAFRGHSRLLKLLLDAQPDVNTTNVYGNTALMKAVHKGHVDAIRLLLEAGADIEIRDNEGNTALMRATNKGDNNIVALLVDNPAVDRQEARLD